MNRVLPSLTGAPRTIVFGAVLTALAIGGTFLLDPYRNFQLATIAAYFCAAAGLTLLTGLSGQLSLGHAALMAAGGYGYALTANAVTEWGIEGVPRFVIGMLAGIAASLIIGLLLGLAAARLHGPYLAGVTLALVVAVPAVTAAFSGVFRGDQGVQIAYEGVPDALKTLIAVEQWQAWIAIFVAGVVVTALAVLRRGTLGLRMRAVRDDATAARLNGVRAGRVKVTAFTVSAVAAGAGGAVLCVITQSVSPGAYTLALSLLLVVAVVIGGLGSIGGAAIGAAIIVMLPWAISAGTSALDLPAELSQRLSGNLSLLVFGALLIVVMIAWPGGLASVRIRRRAKRGGDAGPRHPESMDAPTSPGADSGAASGAAPTSPSAGAGADTDKGADAGADAASDGAPAERHPETLEPVPAHNPSETER